jgi:hypothetical protein
MALRPLLVPGLNQKAPPSFRIVDLSSLALYSSHLVLGFLIDHVLWNFPLGTVFGILFSSTFMVRLPILEV